MNEAIAEKARAETRESIAKKQAEFKEIKPAAYAVDINGKMTHSTLSEESAHTCGKAFCAVGDSYAVVPLFRFRIPVLHALAQENIDLREQLLTLLEMKK